MNDQFDELTKDLAHSITRRGALKKFGFGLAGIALASLGLANKAEADPNSKCNGCVPNYGCGGDLKCVGRCFDWCLKRQGGGPH